MENSPLLLRPPTWTRSAACAGMVTAEEDWWHPREDLSPSEKAAQVAVARLVCSRCPVRHPCALEALQGAIPHGMYGGLTPTDRRKIAGKHGYPMPGAAAHGERSRYVAGCRCEACTEAHRRWAAERRAAGAWKRSPGRPRPLTPHAKVLRAVRRTDGPVSARAVYRATGVKVRDVREIVASLVAAGDLPPGRVA